jgi:hypothetical protein
VGTASKVTNDLDAITLSDKGVQIPIGNGGIGDCYYWTQTLNDLTIYVDVNHSQPVRGKDIQCNIKPKELSLKILGEDYINGDFEETVKVDECTWTVASGTVCQVIITIEKIRKTWWKSVIRGHPEIDTTKVSTYVYIC